jgi:hypothetical protein
MNPNHQVIWLKTRPDFTITCTSSTSTNRGYHESHYEIVSARELSVQDIGRLDECRLLGLGQELRMLKHATFEDEVPPVVVDRRTGKRVECDCAKLSSLTRVVDGRRSHLDECASIPRNHRGEPFTKTTTYEYHRYDMLRICDSGD